MSNKIEQEFQQKKEPVRLNKYLSEAGVCSRREADRLIESGRVSVDGKRFPRSSSDDKQWRYHQQNDARRESA